MVHLLPHWTHPTLPPGTLVPVWVYTNCDEAELLLNGRSLGRKQRGEQMNLEWLVPYEPGTLQVLAYRNGQLAASKQVETAGEPADVTTCWETLPGDDSLARMAFTITDRQGVMVPSGDCLTAIHLEKCRLLGSDNGDPRDLSPMKSRHRRAFNGLGMYLLGEVTPESRVLLAALCGPRYFRGKARVSLAIHQLDVEGRSLSGAPLEIRYTTDGSQPTRSSPLYEEPLILTATTPVTVTVWAGETELFTLADTFFEGEPERVVDLAHLNYAPDTVRPVGPFAREVAGEWESGGFSYRFAPDGTLERLLPGSSQLLGYWWYDYPEDTFEAKDYAGAGEIWFLTGERCSLSLTAQQNGQLVMDNRQGAISAFGSRGEVIFQRV